MLYILMFKYWHLTLLYSIIYILNLLFVVSLILSLPQKKLLTTSLITDDFFWLMLGVLVLAGLPPFSFFFFKIYVFSSAKATYLNLFLFYIINTVLLYFYVNFTSFIIFKNCNFFGFESKLNVQNYLLLQNKKKFNRSLFFWWGFVNIIFILFFEYINNIIMCCACLIMLHLRQLQLNVFFENHID